MTGPSPSTSVVEIAVPHHPDVSGLRFRGWRGVEDLAGMAAANQRVRSEAGVQEPINVRQMTQFYTHLTNCDLDRDLLVVERDGRTIGYARVEWRDMTNGQRQFFSLCVLDPVQRGQGIGQAMLSWSEDRLAAIAATVPDDRPGELFGFTNSTDVTGIALMERNGWRQVARGYEMVRPNLEDVPHLPMPDGLVVRDTTEADRRPTWEAAREAFRDHRDEGEWTEEDYLGFPTEMPDTSLWVIAFDGDEVAGGIYNVIDTEADGEARTRGALATVWTGARWRRRGLAKALIARSLVRLRERGMVSAYLSVDGANPNQAMDLYVSLGFAVSTSTIDWRKALPDRATGNTGATGEAS
jgi:GNAT superfamily N-acetyltransferase